MMKEQNNAAAGHKPRDFFQFRRAACPVEISTVPMAFVGKSMDNLHSDLNAKGLSVVRTRGDAPLGVAIIMNEVNVGLNEVSFDETVTVPDSQRFLPFLILLFVGSGCSALIYEIVWFQLLELVIGSSAISLGVLLGTF